MVSHKRSEGVAVLMADLVPMQVCTSQADLIRKETDGLVNAINNNATIILRDAENQQNLLLTNAQASHTLSLLSKQRELHFVYVSCCKAALGR